MTTRLKTSDESRSSTTTLADDTDLAVSLAASSVYFVEICVVFAAGATPDIKIAAQYTSTLTDAVMQFYGCFANDNHAGGTQTPRAFSANAAFLTGPTTVVIDGSDTANTAGLFYVRGLVRTNGAGTLKVRWAQNTSSGTNATVRAGSYIRYRLDTDVPGTLLVKTTNESRNLTTTMATDAVLTLPVVASAQYLGEMMFSMTTTSDPRWQHQLLNANANTAQGLANVTVVADNTEPSAASGNIAGSWQTALLTTPSVRSGFSEARRQYAAWSLIQGASNDSMALQWAQQFSHATNATMLAGSWMWQEEVD